MAREQDILIQQLAVLMSSGMSLQASLATMKTELKSPRWKASVARIQEEVESGHTFTSAVARAKLIPPPLIPLVRIGEESGQLSQHLSLIARAREKEQTLQGKIQSALLYPLCIIVVMIVVAISTSAFILPRLATLFSQLNIPLPILTRIMIDVGVFIRSQSILLALGLGAMCAIALFAWRTSEVLRYAFQEVVFMLPGTGTFFRSVELTRFGFLLGTLLSAGVGVLDAIHALSDATPFKRYKQFYLYLEEAIEEGNSFDSGFQRYPHINRVLPFSVRQMVAAGEQSGNLSDALFAVHRRYEEQGERLSKNIPALLEPTLLVLVWLGVVAVALAVILPLYRLTGSLQ